MRNIVIIAAVMIGLGTFMAQMADKMSSASATSVPITVDAWLFTGAPHPLVLPRSGVIR